MITPTEVTALANIYPIYYVPVVSELHAASLTFDVQEQAAYSHTLLILMAAYPAPGEDRPAIPLGPDLRATGVTDRVLIALMEFFDAVDSVREGKAWTGTTLGETVS